MFTREQLDEAYRVNYHNQPWWVDVEAWMDYYILMLMYGLCPRHGFAPYNEMHEIAYIKAWHALGMEEDPCS